MLSAIIKEQACIGCGICLDACPFDAIIGAVGHMHTVLVNECIGCKLCLDPCPVDCIDIVPIDLEQPQSIIDKKQIISKARERRISKLARIKSECVAKLSEQNMVKNDIQEILLTKSNVKTVD